MGPVREKLMPHASLLMLRRNAWKLFRLWVPFPPGGPVLSHASDMRILAAKPARSAIVTVPEDLPLKRLILAAVLFAATAVSAQQPQPQPAPQPQSNEMPKLSESIDVRVINVDVVVTDKKGNPVTGLTKDDFEIYENNLLKPISNFYEVDNSKG